jgi:hypothetical protein
MTRKELNLPYTGRALGVESEGCGGPRSASAQPFNLLG